MKDKSVGRVSVIMMTRDRPQLLREALESIRHQRARDRIGQIIVSEGGTTVESKETCNGFPDLPIVYFDHRPPLPFTERVHRFGEHLSEMFVAILHDDDWWAEDHLSAALQVLDSYPEVSATYSAYYLTYGPKTAYVIPDVGWLIWLYTGVDFSRDQMLLSDAELMLCCLLSTALHYSSAVGRREAMWDGFVMVLQAGNKFDTDRTFPLFVGKWGRVSYCPEPSVFVRMHPTQDSQTLQYVTRLWELTRDTTQWLLENHREAVIAAASRFNERLHGLRIEDMPRLRQAIFDRIGEPQWTTLVAECGLSLPIREDFEPRWSRARPVKSAKTTIEEWSPPILVNVSNRLRGRSVA